MLAKRSTDGDGNEDNFVNGNTPGYAFPLGRDRNVNRGKGLVRIDNDVVNAYANALASPSIR